LIFQLVCQDLATTLSLLIKILFVPFLGDAHEKVEWSGSLTTSGKPLYNTSIKIVSIKWLLNLPLGRDSFKV